MTPVAESLRQRIDSLRSSPAFVNYERVRERVLEMQSLAAADDDVTRPSEYWREELDGFEYMLDASPLIIDKLRHHSYHVTGLRVYDYRTGKDRPKAKFEEKLRALLEIGDPELLVPESRGLGGFGHEIDGELYNIDTLKYFEVLIALDRGAVLSPFRQGDERRLVWEVGAGWGGFASQFKALCPNVTYVITDFPELFLFSATQLMTLFPDAKVAFFGEQDEDEIVGDWAQYDFIFLPHTRLDLVRFARMDLTVNMVSFQEMTTEQVAGYVRHAFEQECPYLYSLNRERSQYNPDLAGVSKILERWYWPHEIDVLPVGYNQMLPPNPRLNQPRAKVKALVEGKKPPENMGYRHIVGWRRLEA